MPFGIVLRRSILLGAPLALAVLMLFHSWPYDDYSNKLVPIAGWWTALHTIQFVLFTFMGASVWLLTDGLRGVDVFVSRLGAVQPPGTASVRPPSAPSVARKARGAVLVYAVLYLHRREQLPPDSPRPPEPRTRQPCGRAGRGSLGGGASPPVSG